MSSIAAVLGLIQPTKVDLLRTVADLAQRQLVPRSVANELDSFTDGEISSAIAEALLAQEPSSAEHMRLEELHALRNAAHIGAPPTPIREPQFEVVRANVRTVTLVSGRRLRITPVNRLRVVMVQTGYRRMTPTGTPVDIAYYDNVDTPWLPGVELFGEGVFVDFETDTQGRPPLHFPLEGEAATAWATRYNSSASLSPDERNRFHPVFVWWHTLSHRLLNALAIDSGYSSASIRERVYVDVDPNTGSASGGVLLFTAQPGGDGTLGGLIALVPSFERVIAGAFRNLDGCSNDPLCSEERVGPGKYNGAACYACALVSETACEFRNLGLDRNVLLGNIP